MKKGVMSLSPLKAGVTALLGVGIGLLAAAQAAEAEDLETLKPGVLQVTIEPYMPYTAMKDGKLVGLDSDILTAVADKLGLKMEVNVTDFPGVNDRGIGTPYFHVKGTPFVGGDWHVG